MFEIMDLLGSLPFYLSSKKFDRHGNPDRNGETIMLDEPVTDRLSQVVADIEVEPRANFEGSMTETRGVEEAQNNFAQFRPYIKSDPNLFWKTLLKEGDTYVDTQIRTWDEIDSERKIWKMEKPLPKISSTEAEQFSNLLSTVLKYLPKERISAASLAKHPWFAQPVKLEASYSGESRKGRPY